MSLKKLLLPVLLFCLSLNPAQQLDAWQVDAEPKRRPGEQETAKGKIQARSYFFKEADRDMGYTVYVPRSYTPKKIWPLIVGLHGLKSNPGQLIRYPGLIPLAEKHGYIIICPMGYNDSAWYGAAPFVNRRIGKLSQQDVMNVLGIARKEFNVDPDRVYLMGHSMGGGGAFHLAMKYPETWAALAPIAPAIFSSTKGLEKIRHIPIICIQGARDRLVNAKITRAWVAKMKELGMVHQYIEDPKGGHVRIAFEKMPDIFSFFNKHARKQVEKKEDKKKETACR